MLGALAMVPTGSTSASPPQEGPGFRIRDATVRLVDGAYVLDANVDYRFSPESLEAMESGVPITVLLEAAIERERPLLDERVASVRARQRIKKHALSEQYVVTDLRTGRARTFASFEEMSAGLGRITGLAMIDRRVLSDDQRYRLRVRVRLDVEALPSPLRPLAYVSSAWRLSSEWYVWPLPR